VAKAGERAIIAYFPSSTKAEKAITALDQAGFPQASLKRVSKFGVVRNASFDNALNGQAETLTGLALFSANTDKDMNQSERILMAADPSVSGMSALGYGLAGSTSFSVIAFAPEEQVEKAVQILKDHGGEV
jgi:hypothetical protein